MIVIQFNTMMGEYDLERMSKMYAGQAERGVIILPAGAEIVRLDEEAHAEVVLPGIIVEEEELETE